MRLSKDEAKKITERPALAKERDWVIFKDYRDSSLSSHDLGVVWGLGRAQIQNILNKIMRLSRSIPLSARAQSVLQNANVSLNPAETLRDVIDASSRYPNREHWLRVQKNCGGKTVDEILSYLDDLESVSIPTPVEVASDSLNA